MEVVVLVKNLKQRVASKSGGGSRRGLMSGGVGRPEREGKIMRDPLCRVRTPDPMLLQETRKVKHDTSLARELQPQKLSYVG